MKLHRYIIILMCIYLSACNKEQGVTHEDLALESISIRREMSNVVIEVSDIASAESAAIRIKEMADRSIEIGEELKALPLLSDEKIRMINERMKVESKGINELEQKAENHLLELDSKAMNIIMNAQDKFYGRMDPVFEVMQYQFGNKKKES